MNTDNITLATILANAFDKEYSAARAVEDLTRLMNQSTELVMEGDFRPHLRHSQEIGERGLCPVVGYSEAVH
jgi:hypothetical protein